MEQGEQHYLIFSFTDRPGCRAGNRVGGRRSWELCRRRRTLQVGDCATLTVWAQSRRQEDLGKGTHTRPADGTVTAQSEVSSLGPDVSFPSRPRAVACHTSAGHSDSSISHHTHQAACRHSQDRSYSLELGLVHGSAEESLGQN